MMMRFAAGFVMLAVLPVAAQEKKETVNPSGYKVVYTIRDDKAQRHYTLLVDTGGRATFRAGNRVPVASMSVQPGGAGVATQYNYFDTGISIDCRVREAEGKITLHSDLDISTVVEHDKSAANAPPNPTVASVRVSGLSAVVGKTGRDSFHRRSGDPPQAGYPRDCHKAGIGLEPLPTAYNRI